MKTMPFWLAFVLALFATALGAAMALDIIPVGTWMKLAHLGLILITWTNTVLGNPFRAGDAPPSPPSVALPIAKVASFLLPLFVLGGFACGAIGQKIAVDIGACAIGQVPAAVASVVPDVEKALLGSSVDWASEESKLVAEGVDILICSIEAAVHDLELKKGAIEQRRSIAHVEDAEDGSNLLRLSLAVQRGKDTLARHHVGGADGGVK